MVAPDGLKVDAQELTVVLQLTLLGREVDVQFAVLVCVLLQDRLLIFFNLNRKSTNKRRLVVGRQG